jgi:cell division protein FtsL
VFELPAFPTTCIQSVRRWVREEESIRQYLTENSGHSNRSARSNVSLPNVEKALWAALVFAFILISILNFVALLTP